MNNARRGFLLDAARLAAAGATGLGVASSAGAAGAMYPFSLGVASGSPLPESVILWTRILPDPLNAASSPPLALSVRWEVAEDEAIRNIVARGSAVAAPELAHSVHVEPAGLRPDRWYWYRFMLGDAVSPVGRTRTAPAGAALPSKLKLAVASCQHWEFGHYAAHRHIAAAAPDLVAFLGDYIYEWGPYRLRHPDRATRSDESFTLAQYRARYAQYKSDRDLQAAHLAAPWIVTWDDHEVANDYAGDVDERLSPDFAARRAAAYQAFYEHMPLRLPVPRDGRFGAIRMFQRYDWGRLARFHVLDDRQYRSPLPCSKPGRGGSNVVLARACDALRDPSRTMLGPSRKPGWRRVCCPRARSGTSWPSRRRWRSRAACRSSLPRMGASGPMAGMAIRWRGDDCSIRWRAAAREIHWCWRGTCTPFMRANCAAIFRGRCRRRIRWRRRSCAVLRLPRVLGRNSARRRMSSAIRTCCTGAATGAATC
nr:alkaline phosphatase D family protein [Massilia litorea]